jgi:hypothetical protein
MARSTAWTRRMRRTARHHPQALVAVTSSRFPHSLRLGRLRALGRRSPTIDRWSSPPWHNHHGTTTMAQPPWHNRHGTTAMADMVEKDQARHLVKNSTPRMSSARVEDVWRYRSRASRVRSYKSLCDARGACGGGRGVVG